MTKSMKAIVSVIVGVIFLTVLGVYIYVSTKLDTNELRVTTIHKIEKYFPNLKAEIGDLNLEFGQSIELNSNLLKISNKDEEELLEIRNISLKVPLFSILLGGGNIEVDIYDPKIYVEKDKSHSSWTEGLKGNKAKDLFHFESPEEVVIPAFLVNSTLALRFHNSEILVKDLENNSERKTLVSKFVIKNVGVNSNAAFELKSDFYFKLRNKDSLQFHSFLVGSINLSEYLRSQKLPIKSTYKLEKIAIKEGGELVPMLRGSIDATVDNTGALTLSNSLRGERSTIKHKFSMNKNGIKFGDIKATIFLSELNPILAYLNFPLDVKLGELNISGDFSADKLGYYPMLTASINNVEGKLTDSDYSSNIELKLDKESAEVKGQANLYDGSVTWESHLIYQLNENTALDRRIKSLDTTIKMADLKLSSDSLRRIILRNERFKDPDSTNILLPLFFVLPNSRVNAELVNSKFDNKSMSFEAKIKTNKGMSQIKNMKLDFGDGRVVVNGEAKHYSDGVNTKWKATMKNFSSGILKPFLRENEPFLLGDFNGKVEGPFSIRNGKKIYDFKINLESKKGVLIGINLNDEFDGIRSEISKVPLLGSDIKWKDSTISNDYKNVVFKAIAKDGVLNVSKTKYQSKDDLLFVNTSGKIFLESSKESLIEGTLYDKLGVSEYLKTKLGMKSIPIALSGPGREVKVDRDYTINKFTEHMKGKEGKKKVEKVIDENVDKYIKGEGGKQIKKLLKGFLK